MDKVLNPVFDFLYFNLFVEVYGFKQTDKPTKNPNIY